MPQKMFRLTDEQICKLKKVSELRGCSQTDLIRGFIDSLDEEPPDTQGDTHRDTQEIHGDERSSGADSPALAALIGWTIFHQDAVYRELSIDAEADAGDGIDWDGLRARNPDIAAWVSVEGTPVDFPVVSPREGDPKGFYLNHDFDRNWSFSGCPYLDPRCGADGRHALVYGHHLNFDGEMFTYLRDAWRQEKFDALGDMRW